MMSEEWNQDMHTHVKCATSISLQVELNLVIVRGGRGSKLPLYSQTNKTRWQFESYTQFSPSPPPSSCVYIASSEGSCNILTEISVHSPTAHRSAFSLPSPSGVMSTHATSCSMETWLRRREGRGRRRERREGVGNK